MSRLAAPILLVLALLLPAIANAIEPAGTVLRLRGDVSATAAGGATRNLFVGSTLLVGDVIETGFDARAQLLMNDGASVTLGERTIFSIDQYESRSENRRGVLRVLQGVFLAVSGGLAKMGPGSFSVTTPTAVLGVRGTEFWGQQTGDSVLEVALLSEGSLEVLSGAATTTLTAPGTGVTVIAGQPMPRPKPWSAERLAASARAVSFD